MTEALLAFSLIALKVSVIWVFALVLSSWPASSSCFQ